VSTLGSQTSAMGLATSESMKLGSWTDHGSIGVESDPSKPYNAIDANLFLDAWRMLLNFGSYWHNIFQVEMNDEATMATSEPQNIAYEPKGIHRVEGPYMFKHGQFYYLFYSQGIAGHYAEDRPAEGEEYRIKVCRSMVPTGGFVSALIRLPNIADSAQVDKESKPCTEGGGTMVLESHGEVYGPGGQ
jgi:arabinan endo-1,5-alpha-L-arabinosidase